jgi:uncharacterized membrane protein AbrB (regulator of aidB expression)
LGGWIFGGIVARTQFTEWDNFRSMIAMSPGAAKAMTN